MLKEFTIENYKSFKNEVTFTMEADTLSVTEHPHHITENGLLKVASIYGPNAGGKTNLLKAFLILKKLTNPYDIERNINLKDIEPFKFIKEGDKIITFKVFFIDDRYEIGYHVSFEKVTVNEITKIIIHYENLSYRLLNENKFNNLFIRNGQNIIAEKLSKELKISSFRISDTITFVSFLNQYINFLGENPCYLDIVSRFKYQIRSIVYTNNLNEINKTYFNISTLNVLEKQYSSPYIKDNVINILNNLDINISNIIFEKIPNNRSRIFCEHFIGEEKYILSLEEESAGTITLIHSLPTLISAIKRGFIIVVDEIDAHLHPKLIQKIIELFNSKHNKEAQLIFNSHDILNMNNENFRRDEIWFVYRNENLESELICLSDFENYKGEKVRKDAKYSKQYMEGRYGADPFIEKGVVFGLEDFKDIKDNVFIKNENNYEKNLEEKYSHSLFIEESDLEWIS